MISKRELFEKAKRFPDARTALQVWLETARAAKWNSLEDIRRIFPTADMVGKLAIFNVKGGHYRLIVRMEFQSQRVYVKELLTHAQYDRKGWMKWL